MPTVRRDPEWLESLKGDSPLLPEDDLDFLAETRYLIAQKRKIAPGISCDENLKERLNLMKEYLEVIVKFLKENSKQRVDFLKAFPTWERAREETIRQLTDIADSVNRDHQKCGETKDASSAVSIIGGIVALAARASPTLRFVGGVMMALGSIVSSEASEKNFLLLQKKVEEAEQLVMKDKECTEKVWSWLSIANDAQEALDEIKHMGLPNILLKAAANIRSISKQKKSESEKKASILVALKSFNCPQEWIDVASDVIGIMAAVSMLAERFRPLFTIAHNIRDHFSKFSVISDISYKVRMYSAASCVKGDELTNFQKKSIAVLMAVDVINIILRAKDKNEMSKEAKKIMDVANKLEEEANSLKDIHMGIRLKM